MHFFFCLCFWCHIKEILAKSNVIKTFLFSSKSFTVLALKLRSLIHFEFILELSIRYRHSFILLHVEIQFSYHHLLKRLSLPHWVVLAPC